MKLFLLKSKAQRTLLGFQVQVFFFHFIHGVQVYWESRFSFQMLSNLYLLLFFLAQNIVEGTQNLVVWNTVLSKRATEQTDCASIVNVPTKLCRQWWPRENEKCICRLKCKCEGNTFWVLVRERSEMWNRVGLFACRILSYKILIIGFKLLRFYNDTLLKGIYSSKYISDWHVQTDLNIEKLWKELQYSKVFHHYSKKRRPLCFF